MAVKPEGSDSKAPAMTADVLVELRVVIDGDTIMSRKRVDRPTWEKLWRSKTYLPNLVAAFEHNISSELRIRNAES